MDKATLKKYLTNHTSELKEIRDLDDIFDDETVARLNKYIEDCDDWLATNADVDDYTCGLCHGQGFHYDYEDRWRCHSCFGAGVAFHKI